MDDRRKLLEMKLSSISRSKDSISSESNNSANSSSFNSNSPNLLTRSYNRWAPLDEGVTLTWRDLNVDVVVKGKGQRLHKRIVNSVTGAVKAGSLVALMGASGAGKSSLMAALAYRYPGKKGTRENRRYTRIILARAGMQVEGDVLVNGRPVGDYMHCLSGFMHQEDLFVGSLTVLEHMTIMAKLKLDRRISSYDRRSKIYEILSQLGLVHRINTRIGHSGDQKVLSGGEKKRLAFATELLTDPPLLFCDEPTTGLDSYSAQKLVMMMNLMTAKGKTIVCTIHQPSSELFAMFSKILLLADGRMAFMGSSQHALEFFKRLGYRCPSSFNLADFFVRTLAIAPGVEDSSRQTVKRICDHFAVSEAAKDINVVVQFEFHMGRSSQYSNFPEYNSIKPAFFWTRLGCLIYRSFLDCLRNPAIQGLRILQKIGIAITVGLCYLGTPALTQSGIQSIQGAIFILVAENVFMPMYSVLDLFPQELPLFYREYRSGLYPIWVYYVAKCLAILPGIVLEPLIFALILYFMAGLKQTTYAVVMTTLAAILTMNVSIACGTFFSLAFGSVPMAMAYLVPFDIVLMVTQGVFVQLSSLPRFIKWTQYLSWLMYSTEVMTILQWDNVQNITCEIADTDVPCLTDGSQVLNKYSFSAENLCRDFVSMIVIYFVFHVLAFVSLTVRTRRK